MDRRVEPPRKPCAGNNNEGCVVGPSSVLRRLLIPPELGDVYDEEPPRYVDPPPLRVLTFGG